MWEDIVNSIFSIHSFNMNWAPIYTTCRFYIYSIWIEILFLCQALFQLLRIQSQRIRHNLATEPQGYSGEQNALSLWGSCSEAGTRRLQMKNKLCRTCLQAKLIQSCLILCDSMDCSHQAPLLMGFCRQKYWSGLPFPTPGDLSHPGIEPLLLLLHWQVDYLPPAPPGDGSHLVVYYSAIPWTVAHQALLSMQLSREGY